MPVTMANTMLQPIAMLRPLVPASDAAVYKMTMMRRRTSGRSLTQIPVWAIVARTVTGP